jgi:hypothetical protein
MASVVLFIAFHLASAGIIGPQSVRFMPPEAEENTFMEV